MSNAARYGSYAGKPFLKFRFQIAPSIRGDDPDAVLKQVCGALVFLIGLLGLIGHAIGSHFLKSWTMGPGFEIAITSCIAFMLLGMGIARCFPWIVSEKPKHRYSSLLLVVIGISFFYIAQYYVLAGFHPLLPLVKDFPQIPMAFLTAVQLFLASMGLFIHNRNPKSWWGPNILGAIGAFIMASVLFALLGHLLQLRPLYSYIQTYPAAFAMILISIAILQNSSRNDGLLSPLRSQHKKIRVLAMVSVLMSLLILLAGGVTIYLFAQLLITKEPMLQADQLFVGFEIATNFLFLVVLALSMRVLFYYSTSLQAAEKLKQFNVKLEQQVQERTEQLKQANQDLEAFNYTVSHDLKAPLRKIEQFGQWMGPAIAEGRQQDIADYALRMTTNAHQMRQLTDDLLSLSTASYSALKREPVDLSLLAQEVASDLQETEPSRKVTFKIQEGLFVNADPCLMRSVLQNLISNAWKYTSKTSQAVIEFGQTPDKKAFLVKDNGIGLDLSQANQLFTPFHRMHAQAEYSGSGIGLATVQRIVTRHGGKVWVESAPQKGATFYFTLGS